MICDCSLQKTRGKFNGLLYGLFIRRYNRATARVTYMLFDRLLTLFYFSTHIRLIFSEPDPWVDSDQLRPDPTRLKARRLLWFAPYIRRVSSIGSLFVISHYLKQKKKRCVSLSPLSLTYLSDLTSIFQIFSRYSLSWPLTVPSRPWI